MYSKLEKGDILQFRTCKELMQAGEEMEKQGIKTMMTEQVNGKKGLFLVVTDREKLVSAYLLEKCRFCKMLEKEKERIQEELAELQKKENAYYDDINKKISEFLKVTKCLRDTRELIAITLIEELGL
ncbi:MAG: hypothetical protein Q4B89_00850 [Lachnospiraceae bacterium]|nr:hypothetical protein [Lachnospiraceae bacterium]